jgi:hypothetical protein
VYNRCQDKLVICLVLYVGDFLLIRNDVGTLSTNNVCLRETSYILGIKLWRDRKNKMLGLS